LIHAIPQPGDIGLTRIGGPVGSLIRLAQWLNGDGFSPFEHAFIVLDDGNLIEAQPGGARIVPLTTYSPAHTIYVCPPDLTQEQRAAICLRARQFEGVRYSAADYFAIAAHRLHLPLPFLREYVNSSGHVICSQLCAMAYDLSGVPLFPGRWPGYVTPGSLDVLLAQDRFAVAA
jgi:hypothetical protein